MASQPLPHTIVNNNLEYFSQQPDIPDDVQEFKRNQFEEYLLKLNQQTEEVDDECSQQEDVAYESKCVFTNATNNIGSIPTTTTSTTSELPIFFYYFIGRLNPPHAGHIAALTALIKDANDHNAKPLILLGSGPKKERTLDNPIPFEIKQEFINELLSEQRLNKYEIREMDNPAKQVAEYISEELKRINGNSNGNFNIIHIAGDKPGDMSKLDFIKPVAQKAVEQNTNATTISTITQAIPAIMNEGTAMSATKVRKDAYQCYINNRDDDNASLKCFTELNGNLYGNFYKGYIDRIYNAIIEPAKQHSNEAIVEYINRNTLHSCKKGRLKGGKRRTIKLRRRKSSKLRRNAQRVTAGSKHLKNTMHIRTRRIIR